MADRDPRDHKIDRINTVTTNNTPTQVWTYTPPNNSLVWLEIQIAGVINSGGGTKGILFSVPSIGYRDDGTTTTGFQAKLSNPTAPEQDQQWGTSGYDVNVEVTGANQDTLRIMVTGATAETVHWVGRVTADVYEAACGDMTSGG